MAGLDNFRASQLDWSYTGMSVRKKAGKGQKKGISDNMVIVYSIIFCIFLVIYIRFIM